MRLLALLAALAVLPPVALAAPALADNPVPAAATTGAATAIGQTTATFTATIDPNGSATTYRFEYGTSDAYGLTSPERSAGAGDDPVAVEAPVTGLTSDTTYHVRIVATNPAGTTRGEDKTLRTLAPPRAPGVTSSSARSVRATTATLAARLDPRGQSTKYHFEYGTSTRYGTLTPEVSIDGSGSRAVTAPVTGLGPYTTYHFRLVATNATGTSRTSDRSLRTLRAPTAITVTPSSTVIGWGGRVTLSGRVEGQGVSRTSVAVERTDFPFARPTWITRTFTTETDGAFRVDVGPLWQLTRLRLVTRSTNVAASPTLEIATRALVGARRAGASARAVTLTGIVSPIAPQARVSVQRLTRTGRWVRIAQGGVTDWAGNRSRYRIDVPRARRASVVRVVVLPNDGGATARGVSRELRIASVRRR